MIYNLFSPLCSRMAEWEPSEVELHIFLPIVFYWGYALWWHFGVSRVFSEDLEKSRLHTQQEEETKNIVSKRRVIITVVSQQILQTVIVYILKDPLPPAWDNRFTFVTHVMIPALQFVACMFLMDTWQYFWHRIMHENRWLYRNVHSWHHRLRVPYAFGALYNHPLEGFLLDICGYVVAVLSTGLSYRLASILAIFATIKTVDDHCGYYNLPYYNPFQKLFTNNSRYHDVHHQAKGIKKNFSQPFFTFWDHALGTFVSPEEISEKRKS